MEIYNGRNCITHAELTDGIITPDNLRQLQCRGKIAALRRGCRETPALYDVESLPEKYRRAVIERYGPIEEQSRARELAGIITLDMEAEAYYRSHIIEGSRGLKTTEIATLTNSAGILNALKAVLDDAAACQAREGRRNRIKLGAWFETTSGVVQRLADRYPHNLPVNARSLWRKYNEYHAGGRRNYGILISGKYGNKSAAKVALEEQIAWVTQLCKHHVNLDCQDVAEAYNAVCEAKGWKPITRQTVSNWAKRYALEIKAWRKGKKEFENTMAMQVKRFKPTAPMLFWTLDGWTSELYYIDERNGKQNPFSRLTLEVVLDPYNNYPIGYAIGRHESADLITEALRNAVNHVRELFGERYRPCQLQSDNYAISKMSGTYGIVAKHVTPSKVGNAKAKIIERYFGHLNEKQIKRLYPGNWSGVGILSGGDRQPNYEWLNAHKKEFPSYEEAVAQLHRAMAIERAEKIEAYRAGWSKVRRDQLLPMSKADYLLAFGHETGYRNALSPSGLKIRLLGEQHTYDSFDIEFRRHTDLRYNVKYDPDDLSEVLAVSEDGAYRFPLEEKYSQPMALGDRRAGDAGELERIKEFNRELRRYVVEFDDKSTETLRESMSLLQHPDIGNEYARGMLTDFKGRNKDPKTCRRLGYGDEAEEVAYEETHSAGQKPVSTLDLY